MLCSDLLLNITITGYQVHFNCSSPVEGHTCLPNCNTMDPFKYLEGGDLEFFKTVDLDVLRNARALDDGDSLLKRAVRHGYLDCAEEILKRCPELLYRRNRYGYNALRQACLEWDAICDKMVKLFINARTQNELSDGEDLESRGDDFLFTGAPDTGETALHMAVRYNRLEAARLLVEADTQNKLLRLVDQEGDSALHIAVKKRHLRLVKLLIEADPNVQYSANNSGHTPLWIAFQEALTGDLTAVEIRKLLIEKQPNQCKVRTGGSYWTILHLAAYEGDLGTVEDIIRFCPADCLGLVDNAGQNFLHLATQCQHANIVEYTVRVANLPAGVLNGRDKDGNTPLHIAALGGQRSMACPLLYDPRVKKLVLNKEGQNALELINFNYDKRKAGVHRKTDRMTEKEIKEQIDFDLVVCALIVAVTFTAGITVPGGYHIDGPLKGNAILASNVSFRLFIAFNAFAFFMSMCAVFGQFFAKHLVERENVCLYVTVATSFSGGAIIAMFPTFFSGFFLLCPGGGKLKIVVLLVFCFMFYVFAVCVMGWVLKDIIRGLHRPFPTQSE